MTSDMISDYPLWPTTSQPTLQEMEPEQRLKEPRHGLSLQINPKMLDGYRKHTLAKYFYMSLRFHFVSTERSLDISVPSACRGKFSQ